MRNIVGRWKAGWALDVHTISSVKNTDGSFSTIRSRLGEAVYQLKYNHDRTQLDFLVQSLVAFLRTRVVLPYIDVIIPVPPSQSREFQPVFELARQVSIQLNKPIDLEFLQKTKSTHQLKSIVTPSERLAIISGAFSVLDKSKYRKKKILIIDDLYRSGTTLNEISKVLYEEAGVDNVYVVTLTYTRSNR